MINEHFIFKTIIQECDQSTVKTIQSIMKLYNQWFKLRIDTEFIKFFLLQKQLH